jgi:hypothetical protein
MGVKDDDGRGSPVALPLLDERLGDGLPGGDGRERPLKCSV